MQFDFTTLNTGGGVHPFAASHGVTDPNIISFSVAEMRFNLAPGITEAMHKIVDRGCFGYAPPDKERYDAALTDWMLRRHKWKISPDWAIQSSGVLVAMGAAIRALTEPGDGVILQPPVYQHFAEEVRNAGRRIVENPLVLRDGRYTMDFEDLREKAKEAKMLLLCSPHNPVGRVWTREELRQLAEICLEQDLWVVSDEIHFDLDHTGRHLVLTQAAPELTPRTIVCTAPTKTFNLAGCAISNTIVEDPALRERLRKELSETVGFYVNTFGYAAATAAYETGGPWLDELLKQLGRNREILTAGLSVLVPGAAFTPLEGTYLQWIDLGCLGLPQQELMDRLERAQVIVSNGTDYGAGGEGHIRFNLACPEDSVRRAMDRLKTVLP